MNNFKVLSYRLEHACFTMEKIVHEVHELVYERQKICLKILFLAVSSVKFCSFGSQ